MKNYKTKRCNSSKILNINDVSSLLKQDWRRNKIKYLLIIPVLAYYVIFCYVPMYGAIIAFKDYSPSLGILQSPWCGFENFINFFKSPYIGRLIKNTLVISFTNLIYGFPAPILLALLINELRSKWFARTVQTITYIPHFISLVVVCGLLKEFTMDNGIINDLIAFFGGKRVSMLNDPSYFVPVYVISGIWQEIGWGSIIYLAALMGVDSQLYEAAMVDGAGRIRQIFVVTLPAIMPTIIVMLLLRIGNLINVGYEKIILLYNPATYSTADVISTYVYRKGLQDFDWSLSTAVGLFNSVINFALLILANFVSKKYSDTSLW